MNEGSRGSAVTAGPSDIESQYYAFMAYDRDVARATLAHYVPMFAGSAPVLELGPGRGEFLTLLRDAGIQARGIDADPGMVAAAVASGLEVALGDALGGLAEVADDALGGVFCAHFLEHLPATEVEACIEDSARTLRTGGRFVAVVPNPACFAVLSNDFWRDPTHVRFYTAELLAFLCTRAGLRVRELGGNPRNHPGAPPETLAAQPQVLPSLAEHSAALREFAAASDTPDVWWTINHLFDTMADRLRTTQEELTGLWRAHQRLLDQLFPANEVYVVAEKL